MAPSLAEFLLAKGNEVYGIIRRSSSFNTSRIDPIYQEPHVATAVSLQRLCPKEVTNVC